MEGDCLIWIAVTHLTNSAVGLLKPSLAYFHLTHPLPGSHILAALGCPDAFGVVMPVTDIDDVDDLVERGVGEDAVLDIAGAAEGNHWMTACLFLPLGDGLQPELREMIRTCVFGTDEMHHIGPVLQLVETHTDVLAMEGPEHGILFVVELFGEEDALVACEGHRLRETGAVDVVDGAPRTVHPVGTGFEDVVLEVVLVEKEYLFFCGF